MSNIIDFGKRPKDNQDSDDLDYDAIRESILGEANILNIEGGLCFISTDYLNADHDTIQALANTIRDQLGEFLSDDQKCKVIHEVLLDLDYGVDILATKETPLAYVSGCVKYTDAVGVVTEIHIVQVGYVRFIRSYRINEVPLCLE